MRPGAFTQGRPRSEDGFALISAIVILALVGLLAASAVSFSIRSINTSQVDRSRALALGAADAGADLAGWRMNKLIVSAGGPGIMGFTDGLVASLGCLNVNSGLTLTITEIVQSSLTNNNGVKTGVCPATPSEDAGNNASFSYVAQTDINLNNQVSLNAGQGTMSSGWIIERRVLVTGQSGSQKRRLLVTYRLNATLSPLFERYRYVECTPAPPSGNSAFDAGCSDPGA